MELDEQQERLWASEDFLESVSLTRSSIINLDHVSIWIDVLEEVIRKKRGFNIESWAGHTPCGMVACAGGWLAMSDAWNEAGGSADSGGSPVLNNMRGPNAIANYLGITTGMAKMLVYSTHYGFSDVTPQDVIERLRILIEYAQQARPRTFIIECYEFGGWCNIWNVDDNSQVFASWQEAKAELDQFFADIGDTAFGAEYSRNEYRITVAD